MESKGRGDAISNETQDKAKKRTRKLRKVAGIFPALRAVIQSYFSSTGVFRSKITDPIEFDEMPLTLE
ncbi:hypothetical protein [Sporosarcina beigongshangi]|uniref:hypothetical protein n=1 Tax=Sporosarcina beigongshangi TaxID=2782538 RepID=UPI00193A3F6D|nr:hypothetical protein [Sporosarcina beigongshangi]